jgi:hypothetical protein
MLKNITNLISYRFSPFQWTSAIRQGFATLGGYEHSRIINNCFQNSFSGAKYDKFRACIAIIRHINKNSASLCASLSVTLR